LLRISGCTAETIILAATGVFGPSPSVAMHANESASVAASAVVM
jgi:hypothetical protein